MNKKLMQTRCLIISGTCKIKGSTKYSFDFDKLLPYFSVSKIGTDILRGRYVHMHYNFIPCEKFQSLLDY